MTSRENAEAADRALEVNVLRQQLAEAEAKCKALHTENEGLAAELERVKGASQAEFSNHAHTIEQWTETQSRLSEATALLVMHKSPLDGEAGYAREIRFARDRDAFLSRAPAQAEPTAGCPDAGDPPVETDRQCAVRHYKRAEAAETEVRELRAKLEEARKELADSEQDVTAWEARERELEAQLEAVRNVPRWEPCVVDAEDEDGPVYQGFLFDDAGTWVRWEDVSAILSPQATGTEER